MNVCNQNPWKREGWKLFLIVGNLVWVLPKYIQNGYEKKKKKCSHSAAATRLHKTKSCMHIHLCSCYRSNHRKQQVKIQSLFTSLSSWSIVSSQTLNLTELHKLPQYHLVHHCPKHLFTSLPFCVWKDNPYVTLHNNIGLEKNVLLHFFFFPFIPFITLRKLYLFLKLNTH